MLGGVVTSWVCSQAGWSLTPGIGAGKGVPVQRVNLHLSFRIMQCMPFQDEAGQPAEQLVNCGPSPDGVDEVARHQLELVLGGKHADKHDPPTSNVLCAALLGF